MDTIWQLKAYDQKKAWEISRALNISPVVSGLLVQRGISEPDQASAFLQPDIKALTDPFAMKGMQEAVNRILRAIESREKIAIYGDYDVDGTCSIALLKECFASIGHEVEYYVPDRFSEGYGLNKEAVELLAGHGVKLLITVDCGITSVEETVLATQLNMDVIITDHHTPPALQPEATAIINPKNDDLPAIKSLAGVGVSYKLACALMQVNGLEIGRKWLDLVALATIADIVPLLDENRVLVKHGLEALQKTSRPGLLALIQKTSLNGKSLQAWHVSFVLGPHINSAGRLDSARKSIELLLTRDTGEAEALAEQLCRLNTERRSIEAEIYQQAVAEIAKMADPDQEAFLVVGGEEWHEGVIGIVASRLASQYNRPALVISWNGERGKGSARSAGSFDIYQAFMQCRDLLEQFGGHKLAGGLSLRKDKLASFKKALQEYMASVEKPDPNLKIHQVDMELTEDEISSDLLAGINLLAPFGEGNPQPCFVLRSSPLHDPVLVGAKGEHFKSKTGSQPYEAIAFNRPDFMVPELHICHQDLLFELSENTFRGQTSLQLKIRDMKRSHRPDYLRDISNNSARLSRAIDRSIEELNQQRPVLFVYPGYRSLTKHLPLLQGVFKTGQILELHGHLNRIQRNYAQKLLQNGGPRVYLTTHAFLHYSRKEMARQSFPANLRYAVLLWSDDDKADLEILKNSQMDFSLIPVHAPASFYPKLAMEYAVPGQGVLYANRPSTIQSLVKLKKQVEVEAGLQETSRRRAARHRFISASSGNLLIDGTHPGSFVQLGSVPEILLADNPFGLYELAAVTDYLEEKEFEVSVSFPAADLEKNRSYLQRIYPGEEQILKIWTQLQKYGTQTIRTAESQLAARLSADLQNELRPLDLLPALHIMADLGLCQFEKSGSIIAIKLISEKNAVFDVNRSAYHWEGIWEKILLNSWEQRLNKHLVW